MPTKSLIPLICTLLLFSTTLPADDYLQQRQALMAEIQQDATGLRDGKFSARTMSAMGRVPRHEFVSARLRNKAYKNRPLSIGHGQTISQPFIVALMTDLLAISPGDKVFELGTGSGYQAAVLAELGADVYSMEIVESLGLAAAQRLKRLNYTNVRVEVADGYHGWPDAAPFDAIIVTAAGDHIPTPLIQQLKPGGRMVLPVGGRYLVQQLILVTRSEDGMLLTQNILPVAFVPLTGNH
ncbi:MAG: protein-L-isoaspartate(D-aspartate) O-methyltransferase [Candidatus Sedimenticola sp. (ex Thyasira tokunagai)]